MKITVSEAAAQWFVDELELTPGATIRFFGKYGGSTNVHTGFTTGMELNHPSPELLAETTVADVHFFINHTDDWFFHGFDLSVELDEAQKEPNYFYTTN